MLVVYAQDEKIIKKLPEKIPADIRVFIGAAKLTAFSACSFR